MENSEIEALIELMDRSGLSELEIEKENFRISLKKNTQTIPATTIIPAMPQTLPVSSKQSTTTETVSVADNCHVVKSPMVGTFYAASSPDSDPFVHVGSNVEKDSVLCILEAMKVMNEIQSEVKGIIRDILVKNGQPVEFGQPLFKIEVL